MSGASGEDFLIELFREEVRTHCQALAEGLVALEQGGAPPERLEAMMRAAHSIKGAARVVGVQPGVDVAHRMEDCFVRAQKGQLTLASGLVDELLACVDVLQAIAKAAGTGFAEWFEGQKGQVEQALQRLGDAMQGKPAERIQEKPLAASPPAEIVPPPPEPRVPAGETAAKPEAAEPGVVRVSATSLTRLMGLAGQSLVEARWLQPFAQSLLELKRRQAKLAEALEGLAETIPGVEEPSGALLHAARERLETCRALLAERLAEFDRRVRSADELSARLYREVLSSRMRPFRDGVQGLPRLVRDLARQLGKMARLEVRGESVEVDRDILEKLDAPLNHLVRNALDHGLEPPAERAALGKAETGTLRIEAAHAAGLLSISVADDGRGIDLEKLRAKIVERGHATAELAQRMSPAELLDFLFLPGFSTASRVSEVSGRGVGLDVVHTMVHSVGGRVSVLADPGRGTRFQIDLPLTLSVLRAVIVQIAGRPYAFPHNRIDRLIRVGRERLRSLENRQYVEVDGRNVGIVLARQALQLQGPEPPDDDLLLVLFGDQGGAYGVAVDGLLDEQDLVVRPLDRRLGKVPDIQAAAILDDGSPVLIVDVDDLRRSIEKLLETSRLERPGTSRPHETRRKRVLVVDDSITVREVQRQLLINNGYQVETAVDGMEGWNLVRETPFDLVISDIDMPRLDGLELVRRIKADPRLQAVPVIIVSYKDRPDDRLRGLEAGANHYLAKSSFHDDTLIEAVRELIGDAQA